MAEAQHVTSAKALQERDSELEKVRGDAASSKRTADALIEEKDAALAGAAEAYQQALADAASAKEQAEALKALPSKLTAQHASELESKEEAIGNLMHLSLSQR